MSLTCEYRLRPAQNVSLERCIYAQVLKPVIRQKGKKNILGRHDGADGLSLQSGTKVDGAKSPVVNRGLHVILPFCLFQDIEQAALGNGKRVVRLNAGEWTEAFCRFQCSQHSVRRSLLTSGSHPRGIHGSTNSETGKLSSSIL